MLRARPTSAQEEALRRIAIDAAAPPPPPRPVRGECCGRDCEPCVYDYWMRGLSRWAERHGLADALTDVTSITPVTSVAAVTPDA